MIRKGMRLNPKFNPPFGTYTVIDGQLPCGCGQAIAIVEKAGRCLCEHCAKNYSGREMPIRKGIENSRVITVSA